MMRRPVSLEAFDLIDTADPGPNADYENGYAAGLVAGQQAAQVKSDHLRHELVQSLTDISFTYHAARHEILSSLRPLVTALSETILPHCVAQGFAGQLADLIVTRFDCGISDAICVHVHPDQRASLQNVTATMTGTVTVKADATLTLHAAWIGQGQAETYLDMDRHLAAISDLLSNIPATDQRITANG